MPQAGNIAVNDRAATPALHTFVPRQVGPVSQFFETASSPIGESKLTVSTKKSGANYKVRIVLSRPILVTEVVNGVNVPKVARTGYADLTLTFPDTSTSQERKDLVGLIANSLGANIAVIEPLYSNLESIY